MTSATVVLVSQTCGTPAAWSRVVPLLDEEDVPSIAVQMPSCLPESEMDDATFLRSVLDGKGDPVVLVGHSNSGMVLTEVGEHPSVTHLVYVDAAMWDVGEEWGPLLRDGVSAGWAACLRVRGDVVEFDADAVAAHLLSLGWSAADIDEFVPGLRPQRHVASVFELTAAAWRTVPSTFIRPDDSDMLRPLQDHFAARATDVVDLPGDHFPYWRRPSDVAAIIARIARDVVRQT